MKKSNSENITFTIDGKPFNVPPGGSLGLLAQGNIGVRAWKKAKEEWTKQQKKENEQ